MRHVVMVAAALALFALTATPQSLTVISRETHDSLETTVLQGPADLTITIISRGSVTSDQQVWLQSLYELGANLEILQVRSARILMEDAKAEISLLPRSFARDGYDLTTFIPSGIQLYYDGVLEYDFRVLVGHYFLRISGSFVSDTALAQAVLSVIETPADYLDADTSRHLDDRFSELNEDINTLRTSDTQQSKNITKLQEDWQALQGTDNTMVMEELRDLKSTVSVLEQSVTTLEGAVATAGTDMAALEKIYQTLSASEPATVQDDGEDRLTSIAKQYETLSTDMETTRTAIIALNNRRGRPVDQATVDRIVELKKANPATTAAEIADQLDSEGLSASNKEIALIISVYFAEP